MGSKRSQLELEILKAQRCESSISVLMSAQRVVFVTSCHTLQSRDPKNPNPEYKTRFTKVYFHFENLDHEPGRQRYQTLDHGNPYPANGVGVFDGLGKGFFFLPKGYPW
jgi:hypothetical protein